AQVQLLAQARIEASRGRADEALTLLARGNGQGFEKDFQVTMTTLVGPDASGGLLAQASDGASDAKQRAVIEAARGYARAWLSVHQQLRSLDDGGQYPDAVQVATGTGATVFGRLEAALDQGLADSSGRFDRETSHAVADLAGLDIAVPALTALLVAGVVVGLQ